VYRWAEGNGVQVGGREAGPGAEAGAGEGEAGAGAIGLRSATWSPAELRKVSQPPPLSASASCALLPTP
jgi:hypothetical protein